MARGFYQRVASVGLTKVAVLIVSFGSTLVTIRVITSEYGQESYGAVSLIATLTALIPFADLGLGVLLVNIVVRSTESRSSAELRVTVSTIFWVLAGVGFLIVLTAFILAWAAVWPSILGSPALKLGDPNVYMPWYALLTCAWLLGGPGYRMLVGSHRTNTYVVLQASGPVIATAATLIAATLGAPLVMYAFLPLLGSIAGSVLAWGIALRVVGGRARALVPLARIGPARLRAVLRAGVGGVWFTISSSLLFSIDRILLSHAGSAADLATYAISIPLFAAFQSTLSSIGSLLWPQYSLLRMRGELTRRRLYRDVALSASVGVAALAAIPTLFPLFLLITGATVDNVLMPITMGIMALIQAVTLPLTSALTEPRHMRQQGTALFAAVILKVALALLLIPQLGASGVMLATATAVLLIQLPALLYIVRKQAPGGAAASQV